MTLLDEDREAEEQESGKQENSSAIVVAVILTITLPVSHSRIFERTLCGRRKLTPLRQMVIVWPGGTAASALHPSTQGPQSAGAIQEAGQSRRT